VASAAKENRFMKFVRRGRDKPALTSEVDNFFELVGNSGKREIAVYGMKSRKIIDSL